MPYTPKKSVSQSTHNAIKLYPSTEPGRFKYVFIETQSFQTLSPLPNLVRLSMYLSTNKAIKLYPLYRTQVGVRVYLSTHKAIKFYPLYRTLVGLSMYLSKRKAFKHYPLYQTW